MSLIQRAAERLRQSEQSSLIERAAKRLNDGATRESGAAPAVDAATLPAFKPPAAEAQPATSEPASARLEPVMRRSEPAVGGQVAAADAPPTPMAPSERARPEAPRPEPAAAPRRAGPADSAVAATTARPKAAPGTACRSKEVVRIDLVKLQMEGFVTPGGERTRLVEEFRIIKRPLLVRAFAEGQDAIKNGNLIMVTSARPGDGKTFTALNLALSMVSERDLNVLLVDADMHNQPRAWSAMSRLGVKADVGLLDVLQDTRMDLSDVLLRTSVPNLSLLPAGHLTSTPTELFASNRMGVVVEQLAKRYPDRVIIFDTPPVLATSEPSVLAMYVGQILFVVEAEKTSQKAVESSLSLLTGCQNINLVLNRARLESGEDRFGSYAYY